MCASGPAWGLPLVPGEDQHERIHRSRNRIRDEFTGLRCATAPLVAIDVEYLHARQVEAVEKRAVLCVDEQDPAIGSGDIGGQCLPAARVVDADRDVAAEGARRQR